MSAGCTNEREWCDRCESPVCRLCGRCCIELPADSAGTMTHQCPSTVCRLRKKLRRKPLTFGDTPILGHSGEQQ